MRPADPCFAAGSDEASRQSGMKYFWRTDAAALKFILSGHVLSEIEGVKGLFFPPQSNVTVPFDVPRAICTLL